MWLLPEARFLPSCFSPGPVFCGRNPSFFLFVVRHSRFSALPAAKKEKIFPFQNGNPAQSPWDVNSTSLSAWSVAFIRPLLPFLPEKGFLPRFTHQSRNNLFCSSTRRHGPYPFMAFFFFPGFSAPVPVYLLLLPLDHLLFGHTGRNPFLPSSFTGRVDSIPPPPLSDPK